jgi:hypothetical protein
MLRGLKRLFRRKTLDASKKPDRMLDWADPEDRAEGIMRLSDKASQEVTRKMFEELPPTLGVLERKEEMDAFQFAVKPMFIHVAMERMWAVWNPRHPFVQATARRVSHKYALQMHNRKIQVLNRMYPLLRTMEEEMALDMIEKLLERFDAKLRLYENTRTYERDADKSTFHRMALHVASQFYKQRDRPAARHKLIQVAVRQAGIFVRQI